MYKDQLKVFLRTRLPIVDKEIGPFSMEQVRQVLAAATGAPVRSHDSVEDGSRVFLDVLAQHEQRGTLALCVLPKAIAEITAIRRRSATR